MNVYPLNVSPASYEFSILTQKKEYNNI